MHRLEAFLPRRPSSLAALAPLLVLLACQAGERSEPADSLSAGEPARAQADRMPRSPSLPPGGPSAETIPRPLLPVLEPSAAVCDAPAYSPRSVEPHLKPQQRRELTRSLSEGYPAELRAAGETSRVVLWVCFDSEGHVQNTAVAETSGRAAFDRLAEEALRGVHFTPAIYQGEPVPAWVQIPVRYP